MRANSPHTLGQRWSWVQFGCAFLFVGLVAFLSVGMASFWLNLAVALTLALIFGVLAGQWLALDRLIENFSLGDAEKWASR